MAFEFWWIFVCMIDNLVLFHLDTEFVLGYNFYGF